MTQRVHLFLAFIALLAILLASCEQFFKDDFQLDTPPEKKIKISFPNIATFEITQTVTPDRQGRVNEVANAFVISNELNQPISRLKFGINIFDPLGRFESNLVVSYVDSIRQTLGAFGRTEKKIFNTSFDSAITEGMIDIFILDQDVLATHPFSGIYIGEAFFYDEDTVSKVPFINGAIDYKGDLLWRASGKDVDQFTISGRLSTTGQFIGKMTLSSSNSNDLTVKENTVVVLQNNSLSLTLVPSVAVNPPVDSIVLVLNRN